MIKEKKEPNEKFVMLSADLMHKKTCVKVLSHHVYFLKYISPKLARDNENLRIQKKSTVRSKLTFGIRREPTKKGNCCRKTFRINTLVSGIKCYFCSFIGV